MKNPRAIHYTNGGPWLEEYKDTEFALEWNLLKNI